MSGMAARAEARGSERRILTPIGCFGEVRPSPALTRRIRRKIANQQADY